MTSQQDTILPLAGLADATGYVYLARCGEHYKIGKSIDPDTRVSALDVGPAPICLVHQIATDAPCWLEHLLHRRYTPFRVRGEWFALTPVEVAEICTLRRCNRPVPVTLLPPGRRRRRRSRVRRQGEEETSSFSLRLKFIREQAGWSAYRLAQESGVSKQTLSKLEQGGSPSWAVACKLADALDCSLDAFRQR